MQTAPSARKTIGCSIGQKDHDMTPTKAKDTVAFLDHTCNNIESRKIEVHKVILFSKNLSFYENH